jgi:outer membrane protein assembly factor BamD (BamD/ComL family)
MKKLPKALLAASVAVIALVGTASVVGTVRSAYAAEKKDDGESQSTRHLQSLSKPVYDIINKAQMALDMKMYEEAIKLANDVLGRKGLNEYEQVVAYQVLGFAQYSNGDNKGVIATFQKILAIAATAKGLPEGLAEGVQYNLAQLYIQEGQYDKGVQLVKDWLKNANNPGPDPYILIGSAYAQKDDYKGAIPYFEQGMDVAKKQGKEVQQSWYQNLFAMYIQTNQYAKAEPLIELLVEKWPTKDYLLNLSSLYGMMKREKDMLGILDVMYRKNMFNTSDQIVQLSQLWQYHDAPYRGAVILKKGIDDGVVEKTSKNYEALANAYVSASEVKKAIPYLQQAASLAKDGDLYVRLGEAFIEDQKWDQASDALKNAFSKGGLDNASQATYLRGIAEYNQGKLGDAKKSFAQCQNDKNTGKSCQQYLLVIRNKEKSQGG